MKLVARLLLVLALLPTAAPASASARVYTVRGTALSPGGDPLAGAEVRLTHLDAQALQAGSRPAAVAAVTGADGRFTLAFDLEPLDRDQRARTRWLLTVAAPGLARYSEELPRTYSRGRAGRVEELGALPLTAARTAVGRLELEPGRRAVTGISLWPTGFETIDPWAGRIGADGRFAIEALAAGEYLLLLESEVGPALFGGRVVISDDGCERAPAGLVCDLGGIRVGSPRRVAGRVVDRSGEPIAGVELTLEPRFHPSLPHRRLAVPARSDERGLFVLPLDRAASSYGLTARSAGHRRHYEYRQVAAGAGDRIELPAALVLEPAAPLAGRIVDSAGRAIAAARVVARQSRRDGGVMTSSDPDGRFTFADLAAGEYRIEAQAPGFRSATVTARAATLDQPGEPLAVALERLDTFELEIVVRAPDGTPVAGADVEVWRQGGEEPYFSDTSETDAAGRTRVSHLPAGAIFSLRVQHPDHPQLARRGLDPGPGDAILELELEPPTWESVELTGTVLAPDGSPWPGARVVLESLVPGTRRVAGSDERGLFRLGRVRAGAYRLVVDAGGFALSRRELVVEEAMTPLEVRLGTGTRVAGEIHGLDAEQLSRVRVSALGEGVGEPLVATVRGSRYWIDAVGSGEWWLQATLDGTHLQETVQVEPGASEVFQSFGFPPLYRVRCRVTLDQRPVTQASVGLSSSEGSGRSYEPRLEGDGVFVFSAVAAGGYNLDYHGEGGGVVRPLEVESDLDLHVDLATGWLEGRVVDAETGGGIDGLEIAAYGQIIVSHTRHRFEAVTDAAGRFRLGPMIEGPWKVSVRDDHEPLADEDVTISGGITTEATLRVRRRGGLRLRVETEGADRPSHVELTLRAEDGRPDVRGSASLDAAGEGWWRRAPEGRWKLAASDGFAWVWVPVEIPGEPVVLRFPLAGTLRVQVPALELETDVDAVLEVEFQGEGRPGRPLEKRRGLSARNRWFRLVGLQPGRWTAVVTAEDGRVWTGEVEIRPEAHNELVLHR